MNAISDRIERPTGLAAGGIARRPAAIALIVLFWPAAFAVSSVQSSLMGEAAFALIGGHRAAAFLFGAGLAFATACLLDRAGPGRERERMLVATGAMVAMPVLHALFFKLTCIVAPIPGLAPMTTQECIVKGLLATGYFAAWMGLHLAMIYHGQAQERRSEPVRAAAAPREVPEPRAVADVWPERAGSSFWASFRNQLVRVGEEEILWVKAQKDYVVLHGRARDCIMRRTLASVEAELDPRLFVRIHRSALVRRSIVAAAHRRPSGALVVTTDCGAELPVGRSYAGNLRALVAGIGEG